MDKDVVIYVYNHYIYIIYIYYIYILEILQYWNTGILEYWNGILLSHKKNVIMLFVVTWMDLKGILLSEISHKEKDKYHMISLIYGI